MASIFGAIAGGFGGLAEQKATDLSALTDERLFGDSGRAKAGVPVTLDSALKVSTVLACVRVLANGVAQIPLKVYREDDDGNKSPEKTHPLYHLLWRRPSEWMTSFEMRQLMMAHATLTGNAYAYIGRGGSGDRRRIIELIPLTGSVTPKQSKTWEITYEVRDADGTVTVFPRKNILHIRNMSWNGYAGMDCIRQAREAIGLAIATEETHGKLHANGAKPGGMLSFDKQLSKEAYKRLKVQAEQAVEGLNNAFRTLILDNGAKFTPFAMTGVDSQHIETRKFQIEEICRCFGVFPQMIGHADKTATFASAEAFFQAHVTHTLEPWVENWQQSLSRDLFDGEKDVYAEFSLQGLLRGDHKSRAEYYASGIGNGWLTRNEARRRENLNAIDGLDEPLTPLNMATSGAQPGK